MSKPMLILLAVAVVVAGVYFLRGSDPQTETVETMAAPAAQMDVPRAIPKETPIVKPTGAPATTTAPSTPKADTLVDTAFNLIHDLLNDKRPGAALDALKELLKKDPNNDHALLELGLLLAQNKGNEDKAIHFLDKALENNPNNDQAVGALLGLASENPESVHQALSKAYEKNPSSNNVAAGLGKTSLDRGDYDRAIPLLEQSSKDPRFAESSYNSLVEAYQQTGAFGKAADTLQRKLAWKSQQLDAAKAANQDYKPIEAQMIEDQFQLANAYYSNRQFREAERFARNVLAADPNHAPAKALLERINSKS